MSGNSSSSGERENAHLTTRFESPIERLGGLGVNRTQDSSQKNGQGENNPARVKPALQLTKDRIQRAIRHIKDLVVRRERLILHEFGNSVFRFVDASCLIESSLFTQNF